MKAFRNTILIVLLMGIGMSFAQSFDLQAFADSTKYGWTDYRDRARYRDELSYRQNKLQLYELEALPLTANIAKSAVIPGWGQFATNHNTKATAILSAELVTVIGALYFYNRAQTNYDRYRTATQVDQINDYWSKAETPYHYSLLMVGLAGVIWAYNLYDVVVSTSDYNAKLWEDILSRSSSPIQIGPGGVEVRF
jgi:hypothetical protein